MATPSTKPKADGRVGKYLREVKSEVRKVTWPNRKEIVTYTGIVIFVTAVVALFIGVVDLVLANFIRLLT